MGKVKRRGGGRFLMLVLILLGVLIGWSAAD